MVAVKKGSNESSIIITLDGEDVELSVTSGAGMQLEEIVFALGDEYDGLSAIFPVLQRMKPKDYLKIINIATGRKVSDQTLRGAIAKAGVANLMTPLIEYINLVCFGGKMPKPGEADKGPKKGEKSA